MKTILLSFMLLSTFVISAQAQTNTGNISGKVVDSEGLAVQGATVNIKGSALGSATDENGVYELINIPAGQVTLVIANVGHESFEKTVFVEVGSTLNVGSSSLQDLSIDHHEVTVEGRRSYKVDDVSPTLRLQTPILEVPQNIQVINSQVLADQQIFDMMDGVTRNVSGAVKQEHWENYALIYVRGSQINSFRNGMNTQMPWGPLAEDMSMVDRIEFVKGPAGFMMANGDPAGLYNIVTKKPTGSNKGEATLTMGSFQTYRGTLDLDRKITKDGRLSYRLNLMGQLKGTQRPSEFNNRYSIVPVIKYQLSKSTSVTAEYTLQYMQLSPFGSAYSFSNRGYKDLPNTFTSLDPRLPSTNIKDQSIFVTLNHQINDNWKVTGQLAYLNYKQTGTSIWPSGFDAANDSILNRGIGLWDALGENKQGQFFVNGKFKTGFITHKILAGIDVYEKQYFADFGQNQALDPLNIYTLKPTTTTPTPQFYRSKDIRERGVKYGVASTGLYGQDELSVLDNRIRLTAALRYTQAKSLDPYASGGNDAIDEQITPRVGLSVSITKSTTVYGLYDKAFIPQPGADFYGNRFRPITGDNIEAGIKKDWLDGRWNTSVSVYQLTKNGAITSDPAHPFMSVQLDGQTKAKGVEFDLRGEITKGLNLILNYAYLDSKVTKHENPTWVGVASPGSVGHVTAGWLSYEFQSSALKGVGLAAGYTYQADRSAWYSFGGEKFSLPDYFKLDGSVSWQNEKFRAALNVNNILNEYLYSGAPYGGYYYWQAEPGRNIRASMAYKF